MKHVVSRRGAMLAKVGAWMQLAQLAGIAGTVIGMMRAFEVLGTDGAGDPSRLSAAIGEVLVYTEIGLGISIVGAVLVIIAATVYEYRAKWFFWFLCIYGGVMILGPMIPFGLFFVIYALTKKRQFELEPHEIT